MNRYKLWCGRCESGTKYSLGDRRYRLGASDVASLELLAQIVESYEAQPDREVFWLIRLRPQIREIVRRRPVESLLYVAAHSDSDTVCCLAIWLRGRCDGTFGTKLIAGFHSDIAKVRKVIVRALARLQAWAELRDKAQHDPDPEIRRLALQLSRRGKQSYTKRMKEFLSQIPHDDVPPPARQFWVADGVDLGVGRPPKTMSFIRAILEHIHRLVRGFRT